MPQDTRRRLFAALAAASLATVGGGCTSGGDQPMPPHRSASATAEVTLTAQKPVVARHVSWDVGGKAITGGLDTVTARPDVGAADLPTRVLLVPDSGLAPGRPVFRPDQDYGCPSEPCLKGGATAVVRLADPLAAGSGDVAVNLEAFVGAMAYQEADVAGVTISVAFDGPEIAPSAASVALATLEVRQPALPRPGATESDTVTIHVPKSVLAGGGGWPLVGEVAVSLERDSVGVATQDRSPRLAVGPSATPRLMDEWEKRTTWLGWCTAGADCDIPIVLSTEEKAPPYPSGTTPGAGGDIVWRVEARLLAFDGRTLPPDALSLLGPTSP